jgi:hypothetical protein
MSPVEFSTGPVTQERTEARPSVWCRWNPLHPSDAVSSFPDELLFERGEQSMKPRPYQQPPLSPLSRARPEQNSGQWPWNPRCHGRARPLCRQIPGSTSPWWPQEEAVGLSQGDGPWGVKVLHVYVCMGVGGVTPTHHRPWTLWVSEFWWWSFRVFPLEDLLPSKTLDALAKCPDGYKFLPNLQKSFLALFLLKRMPLLT